jgi:hypothetical protein
MSQAEYEPRGDHQIPAEDDSLMRQPQDDPVNEPGRRAAGSRGPERVPGAPDRGRRGPGPAAAGYAASTVIGR